MNRGRADTAVIEALGGAVQQALGDVLVEGPDADRELAAERASPILVAELLVGAPSVTGRIVPRRRVPAVLLVLAVLLVEQLLVERQALVVERVAHLSRFALR